MKFFIVGMHGSGKQEVGKILRKEDVSVGRLFANLDERPANIYNSEEYELFDTQTVNEIFENNSYMFIHALEAESGLINYKTYEGLTCWEYDQNEVHIFSPNQLLAIPTTKLRGEDICFVWLDNTRDNRMARYLDEGREYSFGFQENVESQDMDTFVRRMYGAGIGGSNVLYFTNELPERVAAVVYSCIKYPDLLNVFTMSYK